jgi:hypothetical protein
MLGWSMIGGKGTQFRGPYEINFCAFASEAVNARRSRQVATHPTNKVKLVRPETTKRNGLLA